MSPPDRQPDDRTGLTPVGIAVWLGGGAVIWVLLDLFLRRGA